MFYIELDPAWLEYPACCGLFLLLPFAVGAGIMYAITSPFGLDYTQSSLAVCIYAVPIISTISILPALMRGTKPYSRKKKRYIIKKPKTLKRLNIATTIYLIVGVLLCFFFAHTYPYSGYTESFQKCYNHLMIISEITGFGYEFVNVIIYMIIFPFIVFFNLIIMRIWVAKISPRDKTKLPPIPTES